MSRPPGQCRNHLRCYYRQSRRHRPTGRRYYWTRGLTRQPTRRVPRPRVTSVAIATSCVAVSSISMAPQYASGRVLRSVGYACDDPARVLVDAVGEAHRCVERVDGEESPLSRPRVRCNPLSIAKRWSQRRVVVRLAPRTWGVTEGGPGAPSHLKTVHPGVRRPHRQHSR